MNRVLMVAVVAEVQQTARQILAGGGQMTSQARVTAAGRFMAPSCAAVR